MSRLARRTSRRSVVSAAAVMVGMLGCRGCDGGGPPLAKGNGEAGPMVVSSQSPSANVYDLKLLPVAVALRSGPRVWMWVDGRSSAVAHPTDDVRWSASGFEFTVSNGLTKVLAPGGSFYYRMSPRTDGDTRPVATLFDGTGTAPPGWSLEFLSGAGAKRVQAFLNGPEDRRVRLGLFLQEPDARVWLTGVLPTTGAPAPPLPASVELRRADDVLLAEVPSGAEPLPWVEIPESKVVGWMEAVQPFHSAGPPLEAGVHVTADLDRDGALETVLCFDGAVRMLDPRCVLVDEVDGETRMYAVGLPWQAGGKEPVGFAVDGAPYVLMVSPDEPSLGFVLRYYGAGWVAEPVR